MHLLSRLRDFLRSENELSDEWLKHRERAEMRIEFHSPRMRFPIDKSRNERSWMNTYELRREAEQMRKLA